jgi:hypothetical protein
MAGRSRISRSGNCRFRRSPRRGISFAALHNVLRLDGTYLPLRRVGLCLDCEACFEIGTSSCPACSGDTWVVLAKFLNAGPLKILSQVHSVPKNWAAATHHGDVHASVVKQLLIVARDRQKLYEYAKRAFADNSTVEVILDRRSAEQRSTHAPKPERRRGDRHLIQGINNHLKALGWAIVRIDVLRTTSAIGSDLSTPP